MKITGIELGNIKSFKRLPMLELSKNINVFIGENNSGKSTILHTILNLQQPILNNNYISLTESSGFAKLEIMPSIPFKMHHQNQTIEGSVLNYYLSTDFDEDEDKDGRLILTSGKDREWSRFNRFSASEPDNLIYPHLSKRKVVEYSRNINSETTNSVTGNFENLFAKIDRLSSSSYPRHDSYSQACKDIIGFEVGTSAVQDGKQAVLFVGSFEEIPLTEMGQGIPNLLSLITDLCLSENKVFLIEEPENDIHPKALKALLSLIIQNSGNNQFFITTHSNIVAKHLGGVDNTKIFRVVNDVPDENLPLLKYSSIDEMDTKEKRREVLQEIGYDFFDFDLWEGWLILEESSAERLIRDYFIKWYTPNLVNKLRTFAAGSSSKIITSFEDFQRLFVFLHLQEGAYKNRAWVCIDSGEDETKIIESLKRKFCNEGAGWDETQFQQFSKHDFEEYYPEQFQEKAQQAIAETDKQVKRRLKKELLDEVITWIDENKDVAKIAFEESAKDVIEVLKSIDTKLNS